MRDNWLALLLIFKDEKSYFLRTRMGPLSRAYKKSLSLLVYIEKRHSDRDIFAA